MMHRLLVPLSLVAFLTLIWWSDKSLNVKLGSHPLRSELVFLQDEDSKREAMLKGQQLPRPQNKVKPNKVKRVPQHFFNAVYILENRRQKILWYLENKEEKVEFSGNVKIEIVQDNKVVVDSEIKDLAVPHGNVRQGEFTVDPRKVDLSKPFLLQGAYHFNGSSELEFKRNFRMQNTPLVRIPLSIDGRLDDWEAQGIKPKKIDFKDPWSQDFFYPLVNGTQVIPPEKPSVDFSFCTAWDAEFFYIAVRVRDEVIDFKDPMLWKRDGIEVHLNLDEVRGLADPHVGYDRSPHRKGHPSYVEQFAFSLPRTVGSGNMLVDRYFFRSVDFSGIENICRIEERGYVMEIAIPWKCVNKQFEPRVGYNFGFTISLDDNDGGVGNFYQWTWVPTFDVRIRPWNSHIALGSARLVGSVGKGP
ncbi:MAG: hypothetical protein HQL31_01610 [Planctomycetes bacterium]|nr:hypothetical protein [Planctomycetota bacterium]